MQRSALIDLHERAGARLTGGDAPLLLTYGDVPGEYGAAVEGAALFDATDRGALRVTGGERDVFLHRLLSNDVRKLEAGSGGENMLLSSKGKVQLVFDLALDQDEIRISTPRGEAGRLLQALDMYLFTEDVVLEDVTEEHAALELVGPRARELAQAVLGELGVEALWSWSALSWSAGPVQVQCVPVAGSPGLRLETSPAVAPTLWQALVDAGATPAGMVAHDSLRCEAGQGAWGVDVSDACYPQEARLDLAFSLDKGCYIGQEVVAKIDTYGGLNKRLLPLAVSHDDPVAPGTRLYKQDGDEWRDLGVVTSWAYSFALDGGIVLAYLKRRHQAADTLFRIDEGPAEARVLRPPLRAGAIELGGELE